jgi:hydroxymethylpyrimidine pyrophosphatase-like HAD family hydrolase
MHYSALATDYDGTLAEAGTVSVETLAALERAKQAGLRLLLVTGRELTDLFNTFPEHRIFDRIVAENGAVVCEPRTARCRGLAAPPPAELVAMLNRQNVPFTTGYTIVATVEPYEHVVLSAIHALGLEWHVVFNKGAVMALPADVTKATGLGAALEELNVAGDRTVGVGDAENDHAFLAACGLAVAVANAIPSLKAEADVVTVGARGRGVEELIDRLLAGDLQPASRSRST